MLNPTERDAESDAEGLAVSLAVAAQQGVVGGLRERCSLNHHVIINSI